MAFYAKVIGTGSHLPGPPVSNIDLVARGVDTSDEWIVSRTGIRQRHLADCGETSCDLAISAAGNALQMAGVPADSVDLIIVATSTPDYIFPSTACLVQARLGNHSAACFDVQAVCCGFVYAMTIAEKFIVSGTYKRVLVIGSEVFSHILDWQDRATCVLFGDGAGAVLLEAADTPGIIASALHSDGRYSPILSVPGRASYGRVVGDPFLRMDGGAVFKFAVRVLAEVAKECCVGAGVAIDEIDWMIPHQANIRILEATAKRLGVDMARVIVTLDAHGNTSAASIPLAIDTAVRDGRIRLGAGQAVMLQGVGGGITWGGVLLRS